MALKSKRPWTTVIFGVFLGFTASSWLIVPQVLESKRKKSQVCLYYSDSSVGKSPDILGNPAIVKHRNNPHFSQEEDRGNNSGHRGKPISRPNNFLYVGVMTAKKYLRSRAVAAYKTWVSSIPGKVEFFSSAGSSTVHVPVPVPVVSLAGVDDSYPPQKKSFMMLKYIHDHYLEKYEWFMRADDDVYIRGEKLELFLRSLNSSKPLYLGQTGLGMAEELGRLALEPGENFCMGGPGMIFSREVLRRMVPHISTCLREMYTTHEDVEVGRCVRRFGGTQCVWSYEIVTETERLPQKFKHCRCRRTFLNVVTGISLLERCELVPGLPCYSSSQPVWFFRFAPCFLMPRASMLDSDLPLVQPGHTASDDLLVWLLILCTQVLWNGDLHACMVLGPERLSQR